MHFRTTSPTTNVAATTMCYWKAAITNFSNTSEYADSSEPGSVYAELISAMSPVPASGANSVTNVLNNWPERETRFETAVHSTIEKLSVWLDTKDIHDWGSATVYVRTAIKLHMMISTIMADMIWYRRLRKLNYVAANDMFDKQTEQILSEFPLNRLCRFLLDSYDSKPARRASILATQRGLLYGLHLLDAPVLWKSSRRHLQSEIDAHPAAKDWLTYTFL